VAIDPDAFKTFQQLVEQQGMTFESYTVHTDDGYHLAVYRVYKTKGGPPVFLQHGLFSSADTWVVNKANSPAFIAARAGYDVWLGNNRGNKYSRSHDTLNPDKDFK
jgi:pimeloyl-ACP methyl ester carboxylesterase